MRLFRGKTAPAAPNPKTQLRSAQSHPFGMLRNYTPLGEGNIRCYRGIREALPIIDAAIGKIVRLCSGFHAACGNDAVEAELNRFLATVNVGRGQRGLQSFLDCYLDSMLTCGRAVGEIVTADGRDIAAVLCGDVTNVVIREGPAPLQFEICDPGFGEPEPLPWQELLLFTPYAPETGHPYGVSLLRSMPYLADVLMTVYHSIESNFRRCGNLRYAVTYKPGGDSVDRANAAGRLQQIAREWSSAMQSTGKGGSVRDFVALGDVDIRTIGADSQIPDTEAAVRQILEQLVSKTGLPPFLLGLSWASTERMSAQQADLLTSELTSIRRSLTPVIEKVCDLWLALHGYAADYEVAWDDINLQDEVEEAKARWYDAQTERIKREVTE